MFIDESGDHNLAGYDSSFPVFTLCGILIAEDDYQLFREGMNEIKQKFWSHSDIIFHSSDIRKCRKDFVILLDIERRQAFYEELNDLVYRSRFTVISASIRKPEFIHQYGKLEDVYSMSLSFIVERTVFCLDGECKHLQRPALLDVFLEVRGKREDRQLSEYYNKLREKGTGYVEGARIKRYFHSFQFSHKKDNINGLQLADLVAYPIARYVLDNSKENPAFDVLKGKIYGGETKRYGLKIFP